ncbi:MAG: helix-turn-helix domain-containing protein [Deltaproteobacteria bacterium]|nr:helix-turn-helix domain-containing protein [Deltaproteobacteria bacterium]
MARKRNPHLGTDAARRARDQVARDRELGELVDAERVRLALAAKVRQLREKHKLTQAELAARVGTAQPNIARLEAGRVAPRLDLLSRIADVLGVRIELVPKRQRSVA